MENSMLEHSVGLKLLSIIAKPLLLFAAWLGFYPAFDFVVIQVDHVAFLSPYMKSFLNDIKQMLGVVLVLLLIIKVWFEITKIRKK